ncbi:MAG: hypothetical protein ABMA15_15225 [Vicinamibacterales bacterium]
MRNLFVITMVFAALTSLGAQTPPTKADLVMVAGCLREQPAGTWRVVNATEPKPSNAAAPPPEERPTLPIVGTRQFQLIGVSIFNLPSYREQTVVLKGVLVLATPVSRLNITSVVSLSPTCGSAK